MTSSTTNIFFSVKEIPHEIMPTTDRNISTNMSVDTLDMCATIQRKKITQTLLRKTLTQFTCKNVPQSSKRKVLSHTETTANDYKL